MNKMKSIGCAFMAACCFMVSGCIYQVPLTSKPTRPIDERLLGNWTSADGKSKLKVVKLDDHDYIALSDGDLYRVYHSDVAGLPLVTVQILDSSTPTKYCYYTWNLSDDGTLRVRVLNDKIIPDEVKSSAAARTLVKKNSQNPELFGDETQLTKDK